MKVKYSVLVTYTACYYVRSEVIVQKRFGQCVPLKLCYPLPFFSPSLDQIYMQIVFLVLYCFNTMSQEISMLIAEWSNLEVL